MAGQSEIVTAPPAVGSRRKLRAWDIQPYVFILPAFLVTLIFHYYPLVGLQIAFKDFIAPLGLWGSPWVGLKHFIRFFTGPNFSLVVLNTLKINFLTLIFSMAWPMLLALSLNEIGNPKLRGIIQTIT